MSKIWSGELFGRIMELWISLVAMSVLIKKKEIRKVWMHIDNTILKNLYMLLLSLI